MVSCRFWDELKLQQHMGKITFDKALDATLHRHQHGNSDGDGYQVYQIGMLSDSLPAGFSKGSLTMRQFFHCEAIFAEAIPSFAYQGTASSPRTKNVRDKLQTRLGMTKPIRYLSMNHQNLVERLRNLDSPLSDIKDGQ